MITAEYAIDTIKSRLIQLIDSGQLNAKYNDIDDSISFYVNKIDIGIAVPLLTLRISDHHPKLKHYTDGHREPWKSYNISIEFYEPKYDSDGEVQQNPFKRRVQVPLNSDANYFTVIAYEYKPQNLETEDVDAIYNAIMEYVQGDGYTDPFINDRLKKAKRYIRTSILKFRGDNSYGRWFSEINAERNKQDGWGNATQAEINWWKNKNIGENKDIKQYTNMNKKLIRLTESDLHRIVKESVNKILSEAINELDPRTYASYAYKRAQQANSEPDEFKRSQLKNKSIDGRLAARDAWNKQYGFDIDNYNGGNRTNDRSRMSVGDDYGYVVDNTYSSFYDDDTSHVDNRRYNPYKDSTDVEITNTDASGKEDKFGRNNMATGAYQYGNYVDARNKGLNVAKQMAQGNGKYVKGQGWK